jgi:PAS domain S-box-containing protein
MEEQRRNSMLTSEANQHPNAAGPARPELPLARIIALAPEAIIVLDAEQHIVLFNGGAVRIFGYSPIEALGQPLDLLLPERRTAAHRVAVHDFAAAAESARPTLMGEQRRVLGRRRDGDEFPAEATIIKLVEGNQLFFAAIVRDISARCRDEAARLEAAEALHHYASRLHMLYDISRSILVAASPEAIAEATVRRLRHLVPCQYVSVVACGVEPGTLTLLAAAADLPRRPAPALVGDLALLRQGQAQQIADLRALDRIDLSLDDLRAAGLRALLSLPLIAHGDLVGNLCLGAAAPAAFTPDHRDLAAQVADQLAIAIENARLFTEVHAGREQLQELSHRLIEAQEAERRTIAAELHDQIGQALTIVKMSLQAIPSTVGDHDLSPYLAESAGAVERALQQVRNLSLDLRPPMLDDLGLVAALRWYAARQARLAGFSLHLQADPNLGQLPPVLATACFRIAQEALTNIARHAQAGQVWVELGWEEGRLLLRIRDDGRGFNPRAVQDRTSREASLGLLGMRERVLIAGGRLSITSTPGQGTCIQADFPLAALPVVDDEG